MARAKVMPRRTVKEEIMSDTGYTSWSLDDLKRMVADAEAKCPPECLNTVRLIVDSEIEYGYYDNHYSRVSVVLAFDRPETDEEYQKRLDEEGYRLARQEAEELKAYEALQKKLMKSGKIPKV